MDEAVDVATSNEYVAGKLREWRRNLKECLLPPWDEIPDIGLYMDQVVPLIGHFVEGDALDAAGETLITPATINNYVRTNVMPRPVRKRYYRVHIAYLLVICTLKPSLTIALIKQVIPNGISEEDVKTVYETYAAYHSASLQYFIEKTEKICRPLLGKEPDGSEGVAVKRPEELVIVSAVVGGLSQMLSQRLLELKGEGSSSGDAEKVDAA